MAKSLRDGQSKLLVSLTSRISAKRVMLGCGRYDWVITQASINWRCCLKLNGSLSMALCIKKVNTALSPPPLMQAVHDDERRQSEGLANPKCGLGLHLAAYEGHADGHERQQYGMTPVNNLSHIVDCYVCGG